LVLIASAHTHRFLRMPVTNFKPAHDFSLSLSGAAQGLAAWSDEPYSFDEAGTEPPLGPALSLASLTT
jgi:hypothetical protein